jgi:hypothetical protein
MSASRDYKAMETPTLNNLFAQNITINRTFVSDEVSIYVGPLSEPQSWFCVVSTDLFNWLNGFERSHGFAVINSFADQIEGLDPDIWGIFDGIAR